MPRYVEIELDRPRRLRYDVNALADLEEVLGGSLQVGPDLGVRQLRAIVWAGLKWEDPSLTLPAAGDLIQQYVENGGDPAALQKAVFEALVGSCLVRSIQGEQGN